MKPDAPASEEQAEDYLNRNTAEQMKAIKGGSRREARGRERLRVGVGAGVCRRAFFGAAANAIAEHRVVGQERVEAFLGTTAELAVLGGLHVALVVGIEEQRELAEEVPGAEIKKPRPLEHLHAARDDDVEPLRRRSRLVDDGSGSQNRLAESPTIWSRVRSSQAASCGPCAMPSRGKKARYLPRLDGVFGRVYGSSLRLGSPRSPCGSPGERRPLRQRVARPATATWTG